MHFILNFYSIKNEHLKQKWYLYEADKNVLVLNDEDVVFSVFNSKQVMN